MNDSARQMMADLAKMFLDRSGALTSTGSAGVFALATNTGITQLKAGLRFTFKANVDFAAGSTLNVDSKGGKKLRIVTSSGDRDIVAGEVLAKGFYDAIYDTTANSGAGGWVVTAVSLDDYYNKASADARYMRLGYDNYPTGHQYLANNKRVYGYKTDGITAVHLAGVNTANMAILGDASVACQINTNGTLTHNGSSIWHAGNMGGGSGLNADLLDGLHASWFQKNVADVDYLEVGQNQLAGARYIDLHTDGLASDYNARIIRGSGPDGNLDIVQSGPETSILSGVLA
ncbi:hypothetical protein [uncultured Cohaesibacter sp.]|uniref:hypothetical protein n=1 Tax=uncultured Cohaesibacter sp. TaxID=1002546 RepID=UPI0029C7ACEE|nr:hypothetical protein [uncultured Cohaesibacter sp.]